MREKSKTGVYNLRNLFFLSILCLVFSPLQSQENKEYTQSVGRFNFLNPGVEVEFPTGKTTAFSAGLGIGYGSSYPDLDTSTKSGWIYVVAPFLDVQHKWFYNFLKREANGKNTNFNSANFVSARMLVRGESMSDNIERTSSYDYAIGPTWGIQRNYGILHLLLDVGPIYYFDAKGNGNFFPIMVQLNLGLNLWKQKGSR
ncbi:hypothetical protein GGR32_000801 [Mesonia hippocampi]|uniref:Outer membrane protein beta-barrel domain-containing protein n=1 Tax=Mesonia hippocampi TaxID=1628250 RepID=A0A840EUG1_9FLAO|nr:hypothetical protein [Mesonia hippocampi]MBB4118527.1 hypothetical protein [Mesonia hippocampi]